MISWGELARCPLSDTIRVNYRKVSHGARVFFPSTVKRLRAWWSCEQPGHNPSDSRRSGLTGFEPATQYSGRQPSTWMLRRTGSLAFAFVVVTVPVRPVWAHERFRRNERPVRGDNRTGQAIWALGMDGRSRQIQPRWGGITPPTCIVSREGRCAFKRSGDFFGSFGAVF
jgi:hypothetical protein